MSGPDPSGSAPPESRPGIRGRLGLASRALGTLFRAGMLDPRFALAFLGSLRRNGPTALAGVMGTARWRRGQPGVIDDAGTLTFEEFARQACALTAALEKEGVGPNVSVGIYCRNHRYFALAHLAISALGADALFLNTGFAAPQLAQVLDREGVTVLIYDEEFEAVVRAGAGDRQRFIAWHDGPTDVASIADLAVGPVPDRLPRPPKAGKTIILTSGTTGTPKGAQRQASSVAGDSAGAVAALERLRIHAGGTALIAAPVFHAWGLTHLSINYLTGSSLVLHRRFDPEATLDSIDRHRVTSLIVIPVMMQRILDLDPKVIAKYDTSSLRVVASSGSALPGELATHWMNTFGDNLVNLYGSTEVSVVSIASPEDLRAGPGTAGRVPAGTEIRIVDADANPVPAGTTGRIFVRNAGLFDGYTGGGTKEIVDGFMSIGDVGHLDENGLLFVEGRDDDMIISGGENVFPSEVENLLVDHPDIADVAVIGVADEQFGQRLKAFVVPRTGATLSEEAVRVYVREHLARYKVPRDVVFLAEIPRNPTGKVLKRELREM